MVVLAGRVDPTPKFVDRAVVVLLRLGELLLPHAEGREVELAGLETGPLEHHTDAGRDRHLLHRPSVEENRRRLARPGTAAGCRQHVGDAVGPRDRDDLARRVDCLQRPQVGRVAQLAVVLGGRDRADLDQTDRGESVEQAWIDVQPGGVDHFGVRRRLHAGACRFDQAVAHDDGAGIGRSRNRMHRAALNRQRLCRRRLPRRRQGQQPRDDDWKQGPARALHRSAHGASPPSSSSDSRSDCSSAARCSRRTRSSSRSK